MERNRRRPLNTTKLHKYQIFNQKLVFLLSLIVRTSLALKICNNHLCQNRKKSSMSRLLINLIPTNNKTDELFFKV